ncbi:MAG: MFS transporter [Tissierellia bacterium]|jgi:PPP family 3-phenylpropionic acid transporter|nr:MFS transporter [Tissierellia bacterium]
MKKNKTLHYGLIQSSYWLSYLPLFAYATTFLLDAGYNNLTIGLLFASANLTSILLQSFLASAVDSGAIPMKGLMLGQALMILFMAVLISWQPLAPFYFLLLLALMSLQPFVNALSVSCIHEGVDLDFGISRGMASLAYSVGSVFLGSLLAKRGIFITPYAGMAFIVFHLLCLISFPFPPFYKEKESVKIKIGTRYPFLLLFIPSVVLLFFGYGMFHNYLVHLIRFVGGDERALGIAIGISAFAEVPTMFSFTRISARFDGKKLLVFSAFFFALKATLDLFAKNILMVYINQSLNAVTFGLFLPAAIFYLSHSMEKKDTARGQALLTSAIIAGNVLASLLGGALMDSFGIQTLLRVIVIIEILGFLLMLSAMKGEKNEIGRS